MNMFPVLKVSPLASVRNTTLTIISRSTATSPVLFSVLSSHYEHMDSSLAILLSLVFHDFNKAENTFQSLQSGNGWLFFPSPCIWNFQDSGEGTDHVSDDNDSPMPVKINFNRLCIRRDSLEQSGYQPVDIESYQFKPISVPPRSPPVVSCTILRTSLKIFL